VLRDAGRAEGTVRRQQLVLDRFVAFLAGRGLDTASDRVCIDFIANHTGVRLGSLRESVEDRGAQAVRRPVVLMAAVCPVARSWRVADLVDFGVFEARAARARIRSRTGPRLLPARCAGRWGAPCRAATPVKV
jgi:hypothetical protein